MSEILFNDHDLDRHHDHCECEDCSNKIYEKNDKCGEVKLEGMKVRKEQRQAMFYIIENCSSCGLNHIIYERDIHTVINSIEDQLVFICPKDSTCVIIDNELEG